MAKTSYVPYSEVFEELFAFCGISLPVADFGGKQGWLSSDFSAARIQAWDYLNNHYPDDGTEAEQEQFETWFDMLDNYSVNYWSTEWHYVN